MKLSLPSSLSLYVACYPCVPSFLPSKPPSKPPRPFHAAGGGTSGKRASGKSHQAFETDYIESSPCTICRDTGTPVDVTSLLAGILAGTPRAKNALPGFEIRLPANVLAHRDSPALDQVPSNGMGLLDARSGSWDHRNHPSLDTQAGCVHLHRPRFWAGKIQ
ncbi:uncharacterized protein PG986_002104 [Apiospora aurea]|uniref:Uncharacterized protein n=1 Tax=Apiospora aurea TaxID=335848 RepID=A0ABR1QYQ4_9PEZI